MEIPETPSYMEWERRIERALRIHGGLNRRRILTFLATGPKEYGSILEHMKIDRAALSRHMNFLLKAGLIEKEKLKTFPPKAIYRLNHKIQILAEKWHNDDIVLKRSLKHICWLHTIATIYRLQTDQSFFLDVARRLTEKTWRYELKTLLYFLTPLGFIMEDKLLRFKTPEYLFKLKSIDLNLSVKEIEEELKRTLNDIKQILDRTHSEYINLYVQIGNKFKTFDDAFKLSQTLAANDYQASLYFHVSLRIAVDILKILGLPEKDINELLKMVEVAPQNEKIIAIIERIAQETA